MLFTSQRKNYWSLRRLRDLQLYQSTIVAVSGANVAWCCQTTPLSQRQYPSLSHTHFATMSFLFWTSVLTHFWARSVPDSLLQMLQCLHASLMFDLHAWFHHNTVFDPFASNPLLIVIILTQLYNSTVWNTTMVKKTQFWVAFFSHWSCLCWYIRSCLKPHTKNE